MCVIRAGVHAGGGRECARESAEQHGDVWRVSAGSLRLRYINLSLPQKSIVCYYRAVSCCREGLHPYRFRPSLLSETHTLCRAISGRWSDLCTAHLSCILDCGQFTASGSIVQTKSMSDVIAAVCTYTDSPWCCPSPTDMANTLHCVLLSVSQRGKVTTDCNILSGIVTCNHRTQLLYVMYGAAEL